MPSSAVPDLPVPLLHDIKVARAASKILPRGRQAPLTTGRGCAGRVDLPPQSSVELLSHPAAAGAPRLSCGVREGGRWRGNTTSPPQLALDFCCC
eukprot:SAG25_NODE_5_length_29351_cov_43.404335_4_plen_95_part_00